MVTRNDKAKDESKTQQTTKQAEEERDNVPTSAEKRDQPEVESVVADGETVDAGLGTVTERDRDGDEYDVPYGYVTLEDFDDDDDDDEVRAARRPRTSDSDDPARSWTAQEVNEERKDKKGKAKDPVALVDVQQTPGQTFRERELPDRDVVEAAGINYEQWVSGLPVRGDVPNEGLRQGLPG